MYDREKVILGIVVFLAIFTIPFWYSQVTGEADTAPEPVLAPKAEQAGQCVESADYMRSHHPDLLDDWRNEVVRGADRNYTSRESGQVFDKSLTDTCLEQCHTNKPDFCDQCHSFAGVRPTCWDCHNIVGED